MMQVKTTEKMPLLNEAGSLVRPSYAVSDVFDYNRENVRRKSALKEWEFYQASNDKWLFQVTYGHTSYAGNVGATLLEFDTGKRYTVGAVKIFPGSSLDLLFTGNSPHHLQYKKNDFSMEITVGKAERHVVLQSYGKTPIDADLIFPNDGDAMVIATPMGRDRFYYNYKKNFLSLNGHIKAAGKEYGLDDKTFILLDSGRGVWPYRQRWVWGNGTEKIDGHILGINIGWGFGDLSAATENMLFYDGKMNKLGIVSAELDETDWLKPWKFKSDDGRFNLDFVPSFDNFTNTNALLIHNKCHQVHGNLFGSVVLDDGRKVCVDNMHFFCEHAKNRW